MLTYTCKNCLYIFAKAKDFEEIVEFKKLCKKCRELHGNEKELAIRKFNCSTEGKEHKFPSPRRVTNKDRKNVNPGNGNMKENRGEKQNASN